jgi:hypothetical protein
MKSCLDAAYTWFFERAVHHYLDTLEVHLVEGIRGEQPEHLEMEQGKSIGPLHRVRVQAESRCATITFKAVLAYQTINESLGAPRAPITSDAGVIRRCTDLEYVRYLQSDSLLEQLYEGTYVLYLVWTEDQVLLVICQEEPEITLGGRTPDLSIPRHDTYARGGAA